MVVDVVEMVIDAVVMDVVNVLALKLKVVVGWHTPHLKLHSPTFGQDGQKSTSQRLADGGSHVSQGSLSWSHTASPRAL